MHAVKQRLAVAVLFVLSNDGAFPACHSQCCGAEEVATSTHSTASRAIAAWRPPRVWRVQISVSSVGGKWGRTGW